MTWKFWTTKARSRIWSSVKALTRIFCFPQRTGWVKPAAASASPLPASEASTPSALQYRWRRWRYGIRTRHVLSCNVRPIQPIKFSGVLRNTEVSPHRSFYTRAILFCCCTFVHAFLHGTSLGIKPCLNDGYRMVQLHGNWIGRWIYCPPLANRSNSARLISFKTSF